MLIAKIFKKIGRFLKNPTRYYSLRRIIFLKLRSEFISKISPFSILDDKYFLEYQFFKFMGYKLDFKNPKSFHEKLQWIKLYYRNPLYTKLADKFGVRSYVEEKVGSSILTNLFGVYENPMDIEWNELPNRFVIKTTHGCGWNIICKDKNKLDPEKATQRLSEWLNLNYYAIEVSREWQYKNIPPKIIIEEYLEGDEKYGLLDYKFWCFGGDPAFIDVDFDRFTEHKIGLFNKNWEVLNWSISKWSSDVMLEKPKHLEDMLNIAKKLSEGIPFCRVDLYYFNQTIYFGEITLCPGGGFEKFSSHEVDVFYGEQMELPPKMKNP